MEIVYSTDRNGFAQYLMSQMTNGDFGWFLTTLLDAIEKNYKTEIMDDSSGNCENFYIKDIKIKNPAKNRTELGDIEIDIENIMTKQTTKFQLVKINRVTENSNSEPGEFFKYYVYSSTGDYRFCVFCK